MSPQTTTVRDTRTATPAIEDATAGEAAAVSVPEARLEIDDLDRRIIGLVQERMAVSATIQRSRIASGGPRLSLSREMEILARYREGLGRHGTALGMTLLELCRGRA
ncbi:chorismate mutase [Streptomyces sp. LX-29]|uniref:chorismate mutase n=1 Tax=Streptomyces sp. LX-29 TaxID=2900152 RepID=UPI00240DC89A|nr:chorismate mutase [Streptomyces sp. LX-29]WFB08914.1 chorismate mutase [Streptomyces sp. LX-29]